MKNIILLCLSLAALASFAKTGKISGILNDVAVKEVYSGIQSLSELVAPYKGKVVYLDIWTSNGAYMAGC